ncbi:MAG: homoserine kinase, partial [Crocinitomicaceae bacterium]
MGEQEPKEVRVFAPATVANVASGYDVLGFAIDEPGDEVVVRYSDKPGLRITTITGDGGKLPKTVEGNTAGVSAQDLLRHLGKSEVG